MKSNTYNHLGAETGGLVATLAATGSGGVKIASICGMGFELHRGATERGKAEDLYRRTVARAVVNRILTGKGQERTTTHAFTPLKSDKLSLQG